MPGRADMAEDVMVGLSGVCGRSRVAMYRRYMAGTRNVFVAGCITHGRMSEHLRVRPSGVVWVEKAETSRVARHARFNLWLDKVTGFESSS
jgi:hypothetical protein